MYDTGPNDGAAGQGAAAGYMDVPAGTSGYMDVAPGSQSTDNRSPASTTGYMDVAPQSTGEDAGFGDDDAEEDV